MENPSSKRGLSEGTRKGRQRHQMTACGLFAVGLRHERVTNVWLIGGSQPINDIHRGLKDSIPYVCTPQYNGPCKTLSLQKDGDTPRRARRVASNSANAGNADTLYTHLSPADEQ